MPVLDLVVNGFWAFPGGLFQQLFQGVAVLFMLLG